MKFQQKQHPQKHALMKNIACSYAFLFLFMKIIRFKQLLERVVLGLSVLKQLKKEFFFFFFFEKKTLNNS